MKKLGLLVLALVIALGSLGVGYARWSDTVDINGTVTNGSVCLKWDWFNNPDPCPSPVPTGMPATPYSYDPKYDAGNPSARWDKDVACTEMYYTDESHKTIRMIIHNAYPGYFFDTELEYINCGTIPLKIDGLSIIAEDFTISKDTDWTKDTPGEIYIKWKNTRTIGEQLHPEDVDTTSLFVLVRQSAQQGEDYSFTITVNGSQWNEYTPTPTVISPTVAP